MGWLHQEGIKSFARSNVWVIKNEISILDQTASVLLANRLLVETVPLQAKDKEGRDVWWLQKAAGWRSQHGL